MHEILAIYKPKGWTSFDVVAKIRKLTGVKKVGHAGTLDPLATGVLIVAIGREATKQISQIMHQEKEYVAKIKLGETSSTDDEEGAIFSPPARGGEERSAHSAESAEGVGEKFKAQKYKITKAQLQLLIKKFIGEISQVPPAYSAIKINGQRAYDLARKGKEVKLKARQVTVKEIELISYRWPYLKIRVVCGSGTYIRSLARDIGRELGTGAYLAELERTRIGEYRVEDAIMVEEIEKNIK